MERSAQQRGGSALTQAANANGWHNQCGDAASRSLSGKAGEGRRVGDDDEALGV